MDGLRHAPRDVYRVFSEQDFLADGAEPDMFEPVAPAPARRAPLRRIAGVAMLVGAVVAVAVTLLTHPHPTSKAPQQPRLPASGRARGTRSRAGTAHAAIPPPSPVIATSTQTPRRRAGIVSSVPPRPGPLAGTVQSAAASPNGEGAGPRAGENREFGFER